MPALLLSGGVPGGGYPGNGYGRRVVWHRGMGPGTRGHRFATFCDTFRELFENVTVVNDCKALATRPSLS